MSRAYYNERDPYAAKWLANLIAAELICPGDVDSRDIRDVRPGDLAGYTQHHFFAGIGVWSYALRLAGWPDSRPVWTGSCPCQPFSAAGRGGGFADERHLWPHWHYLIEQQEPPVLFGEQVASDDGLAWLDLVQADLEGAGYAVGASDLCVAGFGAPHIRQRLWLVAYAESLGRKRRLDRARDGFDQTRIESQRCRAVGPLAHANGQPRGLSAHPGWTEVPEASWCGEASVVGHASRARLEGHEFGRHGADEWAPRKTGVAGFWRDAVWLPCRDGTWRPTEPGTFPLAHGASARVGRLRAYGNAISPYPAAEMIEAFLAFEQQNQGA